MRGRKKIVEKAQRHNVGYVRVSTDEQAGEGLSLAAQEERLRAYATALGYELREIVVDAGESAKDLKRPGAQRILDGVRAGQIGAVIVLKLDRLTRSVRDLGHLLDLFQRADARLISVSESLDTSSAAGRMVVNMLGVVAQWERETIAERTACALSYKRRQRRAYAPTPYGFRREGDALRPVPAQQRALDDLRRLNTSGASLRQICAHLERQGYAPPRGTRWHASSVRAILRSRMFQEAE